MGWTGRYFNGTREDRIRTMVNYWNFDNSEYNAECIDHSMIGTTLYCAVRFTHKPTGKTEIIGTVTLSRLKGRELLTKEITENSGPYERNCPRRILDKLTPTENEYAREWREDCLKRRETHEPDHNIIPRHFVKIIGEMLIKTSANESPNTPFEISITPWKTLQATNILTGKTYACFASMLRDKNIFHVDQIIREA